MAFYKDDENEQAAAPGSQTTSPESSIISGQGSAAQQGAQAPTPNAPDKSSNFVGINQYLNANKTQANKLGGQATNVVNSAANNAREATNSLGQEFKNQVGAGTFGGDDNVVGAISNGNANTLTAQQKAAGQQQYNAQYAGPQNITDLNDQYTNASKAVDTAKTNINDVDTEAGRTDLIKQINNKPRTLGQNIFDSLLLQAGSGRDQLAQAKAQNQDVGGLLDNLTTESQAESDEGKAKTDAARNAIRGAVGQVDDPNTPDVDESGGAYGAIQQNLRQQAQNANANRSDLSAQASAAKDDPSTPNIDESTQLGPAIMQALGLSSGTNLYNTDLSNYLSVNPAEAREQDFVGADDLAKYQALQELSGGTSSLYNGVGSYDPFAGTRKDDLQQILGQKKGTYDQNMTSAVEAAKLLGPGYASLGGPNNDHYDYAQDFNNFAANPTYDALKALGDKLKDDIPSWRRTDGVNWSPYGQQLRDAILGLYDNQLPELSALTPNRKVGAK